jgi:hypothetical protein
MGLIKDEPDCGSEAWVPTMYDGTQEGSIVVDKSVDVKKEDSVSINICTNKDNQR